MKSPNLQLYNSYGSFNQNTTHQSIYPSDRLLLEKLLLENLLLEKLLENLLSASIYPKKQKHKQKQKQKHKQKRQAFHLLKATGGTPVIRPKAMAFQRRVVFDSAALKARLKTPKEEEGVVTITES